MPELPRTFRPSGRPTSSERERGYDKRRGSARERGYDSRWDKARLTYLASHPLCVMCQAEGHIEAAEVVDHVVPHRGDQALFWDTGNWQSLCNPCHVRHKQRIERGGDR